MASTMSSYIPTSGSTATRSADVITVPSANLPWPTPNVIGPELVTNGTFDTDTSGWTAFDLDGIETPLAMSQSGGVAVIDASDGNIIAEQGVTTTIGETYQLTGSVTALGAGNRFWIQKSDTALTNGTVLLGPLFAATDFNLLFQATGTTTYIQIHTDNQGSRTLSFDNISVREIDPLSVSIQMDGKMTYADTDDGTEVIYVRWENDSTNYIRQSLSTVGGREGQLVFTQREDSSGLDSVTTGINYYSPGVNVPFNIASRHGSTFVNGAVDGTALTANTTPTALPDLSSTDLSLGFDYMGTVKTLRIWSDDLGDAGIAEAST